MVKVDYLWVQTASSHKYLEEKIQILIVYLRMVTTKMSKRKRILSNSNHLISSLTLKITKELLDAPKSRNARKRKQLS